ncbi:MAG TPA: protein phosphatase 2C domain-containing protein [Gemmatimonadales bacterium]|nr:protein phosphatase 2C domain-containing protein [Gemmatimonadales bacterium]
MALADLLTVSVVPAPGERPRDHELDLFGVTHRGKVRKENQDHFLLATVHHQVVIHGTSLPGSDALPLRGERLATIMLVADGVGGGVAGGRASQLATETVASYVASTLRSYQAAGAADEPELHAALRAAALEAHAAVRSASEGRRGDDGAPARAMATTLTLAIAVWPWAYVVQVGDSRCYYYWDGELRQVTRDQTVAQELVDSGVLKPERAATSPFNRVLASSIGGDEASPVVSRFDIRQRGCVLLLCSDGLTTHVSDAQIAAQTRTMESSEQLCRSLLDLALEGGGTDNITVVVGRARGRSSRG